MSSASESSLRNPRGKKISFPSNFVIEVQQTCKGAQEVCDPRNFYKAQLILTAKASRTTNSKVDCLLPPKLNTVVRPDKLKVQEANRCTDAPALTSRGQVWAASKSSPENLQGPC